MNFLSHLTEAFRSVAAKVAPASKRAWPYIKTGLRAIIEMVLKEWLGDSKGKPKAA